MRWIAAVPITILCALDPSPAVTPSAASQAWLEEFAQLRRHMAGHYANLDWMVAHRGIDLPGLDRATQEALRSARGSGGARRAMRRFVDAFGDPHLRLLVNDRGPGSGKGGPGERAAGPRSCAARGFHVRDRSFRFPFERADDWVPAGGAWFPAGSFGDVAVIRIAHFGEDGYLEACEEAGPDQVRERLQRELRGTIRELRSRPVRVMLLDITGNGGGTGWVSDAMKLFTSRTLRRPKARRAASPCDRSAIWEGAAVCSNLTDAGESTMQGEGAWDGPLAVLVDGRTASASEDLVVWLKESRAATILGERTFGAGCGYVDGGAPARLEHLGVTVLMPNCARFTTDGVNEIEGILPDVPMALTKGPARERLRRLAEALR